MCGCLLQRLGRVVPLRADTGSSVSSYLFPHSIGGQLHPVTFLKPWFTYSLTASLPARSGEHWHSLQLFAGEGEGHKDVE